MISNNKNFSGSFLLSLMVLIGLIAIGSSLFIFTKKNNSIGNKIYPNVYLDNQNFGLKTKQEVVDFYKKKTDEISKSKIKVLFEEQTVATFSAQTLKLKYDGKTIAERAYMIGRSTNFSSKYYQKFVSIFNLKRFKFDSQLNFEITPVRDFVTISEEKYNVPAKNGLFKFENGKVTEFRKETNGLKISSEQFLKEFEKIIVDFKKDQTNKIIVLDYEIIKPEITLSDSNEYGIEEFVAEGKSDYSHSIPQRIHNLTLAASKFNGVLIPKGKTFSFNETIGDISALTGYQPAYIIKDGKTVLGDGGGVCQVSTTLFRAALNAGLPIIERNAHAYRVGYYENDSQPGFDATVYAPSVDLVIKNDTPAHILIETEIDKENNLLTFKFYGKKDNRKAEISKATVYDVVPALPPKYQDDPTLKKGVTKQVDFAAGGAKAFFTYKVFKDEKLVIDDKFVSNFRPWAAVYLVGTAD